MKRTHFFFLFLLSIITTTGNSQIITTVAGGGYGDGLPATDVCIFKPSHIFVDESNNLYISSNYTNSIRKVNGSTGILSTIVAPTFGYGAIGISDGGPAISAILYSPQTILVDSSGDIYIAEGGHGLLRKIDHSTGIINSIAGKHYTYPYFGDGSIADSAFLQNISGVYIESDGDILVCHTDRYIRKIDATTGIITSVCGTQVGYSGDGGLAINAATSARDLSEDAAGNIFFTDYINNVVRRIDAITGIITTVAGNGTQGYSGDGGPAIQASLHTPVGICIDSLGNIYIADQGNQRVRKVDAISGLISTICGTGSGGFSGDNGPAISAQFSNPSDLAIGPDGSLYVADYDNYRIRKIDLATGIISTVAGNGEATYTGNNIPAIQSTINSYQHFTIDNNGDMLIADNNRIRKIDMGTGIIHTIAGNGVAGFSGDNGLATAAQISNPGGIGVDKYNNIYIGEGFLSYRLRKIDAVTGIITTIAGNGFSGYSGDGGLAINAKIDAVNDILVDSSGNVYILANGIHRLRKIDAITGIIQTIGGAGGNNQSGDGVPATNANLPYPTSVQMDKHNNIFVSSNFRIHKIDTSGIITTIVGGGTIDPLNDGVPATSLSQMTIAGMTLDSADNIFFSDYSHNKIRRIDKSSGIITTFAGNGIAGGIQGNNVSATSTSVYGPYSVERGKFNNLYISQNGNLSVLLAAKMIRSIACPNVIIPPDIPIISSSIDTLCLGTFAHLSVGAANLGSATHWQWYKNSCSGSPIGIGDSLLVNPSIPTTYYVRGEGACITPGGCSGGKAINLFSGLPVVTASPSQTNFCSGDTIMLSAIGANTYIWNTGGSGSIDTITPSSTTTYTVIGTDLNGCKDTATTIVYRMDCVWPGDTDYDLSVNNNDLLQIGLNYGQSGTIRSNASNNWVAQPAPTPYWYYRHIDCNGDGTINNNDTLAISLNFNLTHPFKLAAPQLANTLTHDLYFTYNKPSYFPGDTIKANLYLGSSTNYQNSIYGLAFEVDYDQNLVKTGSCNFNFLNSWTGTKNSDKLCFSKIVNNSIYCSEVRTDLSSVNGYGLIAKVQLILKDTLGSSLFYLGISNGKKINEYGASTMLNLGADTISVLSNIVSVKNFEETSIIIYPNPANRQLIIEHEKPYMNLYINDLLGNQIKKLYVDDKKATIDLTEFESGIYFFTFVCSDNVEIRQKIVIQH